MSVGWNGAESLSKSPPPLDVVSVGTNNIISNTNIPEVTSIEFPIPAKVRDSA